MISRAAPQDVTTNVSNNILQSQYFSTLDAAFVYIREYLEDRLGENVSVCVKETTLCINGKEKELYEVSFGAVQQYVLPQAPYTPLTSPNPYIPDVTPQRDEWWKNPIVYCGSVPKVTLDEGAAGTKVGCIMQSYDNAPQAYAER